jgi:2,3-bisphosphoglycerate-independent phosphoglycerate mutase
MRYVRALRVLMPSSLLMNGTLVTAECGRGQAPTRNVAGLAECDARVYFGVMPCAPNTLMIFVDGLGLGAPDPAVNPVHSEACPFLRKLMEQHAVAVDARLGVPGVPQSATGQASLLTGINVAERAGRHVEGFPGPAIRSVVKQHNVFRRLANRGYAGTFANAYFVDSTEQVRARRHQSVTTVAALEGVGHVRDTVMMLRGEAVYQDLTRKSLRERGYTGPLVAPRESGEHLLDIARRHDFTLFEYFQTDRVGHGQDRARALEVLGELDEFLQVAAQHAKQERGLFVLISDHGNIEDLSVSGHTLNPVPLVAMGHGAEMLKSKVRSLVDFVPVLLGMYPPKSKR